MADKEKLIIKVDPIRQINYTDSDLFALHSVPVKRTVVTKAMSKVSLITYLGTKEKLNDNDVIRVGNLGMCYRVKKYHKMTDRDGNIYIVTRVDKASITSLDIDAIKKGDNVEILNRESFEQLFDKAYRSR